LQKNKRRGGDKWTLTKGPILKKKQNKQTNQEMKSQKIYEEKM
jgi:hypothetical protein